MACQIVHKFSQIVSCVMSTQCVIKYSRGCIYGIMLLCHHSNSENGCLKSVLALLDSIGPVFWGYSSLSKFCFLTFSDILIQMYIPCWWGFFSSWHRQSQKLSFWQGISSIQENTVCVLSFIWIFDNMMNPAIMFIIITIDACYLVDYAPDSLLSWYKGLHSLVTIYLPLEISQSL